VFIKIYIKTEKSTHHKTDWSHLITNGEINRAVSEFFVSYKQQRPITGALAF
jgi:hypothetical protein